MIRPSRTEQIGDLLLTIANFLDNLDPKADARFNLEHYTDTSKGEEKPSPDPLQGRHPHLSRQDVLNLANRLNEINKQGAGIFIARNEFAGQREGGNLRRIRGPHADFDNATPEQIEAAFQALPPSIVVTTSDPDKRHAYWQLKDGELLHAAETKAINQVLVKRYGADSAAVDVVRLLRIPGFRHMKRRRHGVTPTVTGVYFNREYTAEEIRCAFPVEPDVTHNGGRTLETDGLERGEPTSICLTQIESVIREVAQQRPELWSGSWGNIKKRSGDNYSSQSEADLALTGQIARACMRSGVDEGQLAETIEIIFNESGLAQRSKWSDRQDYRDRTIRKAIENQLPLSLEQQPTQTVSEIESHGDIRNAIFFANKVRGSLIYLSSRDQWMRWDLSNSECARWRVCEKQEEVAAAKWVCRLLLEDATALFSQHQDRGKKAISEAVNAHNYPRIQAMLKLSVSERNISVTEGELDQDSYKLGVTNGVVELRTGEFSPNRPDLLITRHCNGEFIDDEPCPTWIRFLDEIFLSDQDTIDCVQRLLGYTLIGSAQEEILIICFGFGSNGKSVFNNVVQNILGEYAVTAPSSLLVSRRSDDNAPRNDIAALSGARYVTINELQAGDRLDEQTVKMLAGRERISARFLHKEFFEFLPIFTPWLRTNHKPIITGEDDGIWRRLVLLPFERKFSEDERDPGLEDKLLAERNGILQWMLEGVRLYLKEGINPSQRMRWEAATYRKESDLLGEFLQDKTVPDPKGRINQIHLYSDYRDWCEQSGLRPNSKKSFTQRLAERGYRESKSGGDRFYAGVAYPSIGAAGAQGGMDRISANLGKSPHEDLCLSETLNSLTSCPPRPPVASDGTHTRGCPDGR